MSWNYRLVEDKRDSKNPYIFVAEIYYNDKGEFNGYGYERGVPLLSEDKEQLQAQYKLVGEAFSQPVIPIERLLSKE